MVFGVINNVMSPPNGSSVHLEILHIKRPILSNNWNATIFSKKNIYASLFMTQKKGMHANFGVLKAALLIVHQN